MASPLQLTYSFMWQVIRQRNVKLYSKVEEFITMVTQAVPELMTFKQTAQLLLGLRARVRGLHLCVDLTCARFVYIVYSSSSQIILDLLNKEGPPDSRAIQILINRLKVSSNVVRFLSSFSPFNFLQSGPFSRGDVSRLVLQKDVEVEKSQTNFMVLVQNLQKNPAERKLFFRVPKSAVCHDRI